ncbi:MAG: OmpA family protein [Steroidobacteraceae bacterium]
MICALTATVAANLSAAGGSAAQAPPRASQESALRVSLASTAATVVHADESVTIDFPIRLSFATDSNELLPGGAEMLDAVAHSLKDYKRTLIVISVYTDTIGDNESNQQQSQARAAVVLDYLQAKGVEPERMSARGAGETAQLAAPNTPEGRDMNRRLELTITALSS